MTFNERPLSYQLARIFQFVELPMSDRLAAEKFVASYEAGEASMEDMPAKIRLAYDEGLEIMADVKSKKTSNGAFSSAGKRTRKGSDAK